MNTLSRNTMINDTAQQPAITAYHIEQYLKSQQKKVERQEINTLKKCSDQSVTISLQAVDNRHPEREQVESFIKHVFYHHHSASLKAFMPTLLAAKDEDDQMSIAVGIRRIKEEPIFLEQYLDQPIDRVISQIAGKDIERQQTAEVGNLACTCAGSSRKLITLLVHYFNARNVEWAVCTGTSTVRAILNKLGIEYTYIEKADPERLGDEQHSWGNYYHHNPYVLAIDIQQAMRVVGAEFILETTKA